MTSPSRTLQLIAHDLRSAYNVGSLFRIADSLGVAKIWLTGYTPKPDHPSVVKTALGAETSVDWEHVLNVEEAIKKIRDQGFKIVALEIDERSVNLVRYDAPKKIALLLGNEVQGVVPSLMNLCDEAVYIEQHGKKESLNVSIATAIAVHWIMNKGIGE